MPPLGRSGSSNMCSFRMMQSSQAWRGFSWRACSRSTIGGGLNCNGACLHYILTKWSHLEFFAHHKCSVWPASNFYFCQNIPFSADTVVFRPKVLHFGRNKSISAEITLFRQNIWFRPNFGFSIRPLSVFGVSVKNLFRSDTNYTNYFTTKIFKIIHTGKTVWSRAPPPRRGRSPLWPRPQGRPRRPRTARRGPTAASWRRGSVAPAPTERSGTRSRSRSRFRARAHCGKRCKLPCFH